MDNKEKKSFNYTYSAKQKDEINKIRDKYVSKEPDKMEQLRRLDASVTKKGSIVATILGCIGALVMGTGMSIVMTDIGEKIGIQPVLPWGIAIGVAGMVMLALAYPVYNRITRKERERIAPEILRLSEELLK